MGTTGKGIVTAVTLVAAVFFGCNSLGPTSAMPNPTAEPTSAPPHLSAVQVKGIVASCLRAAILAQVRDLSFGYYMAEYTAQNLQWIVTVWPSEELSMQSVGSAYVVDDSTGKVLNCPPAFERAAVRS